MAKSKKEKEEIIVLKEEYILLCIDPSYKQSGVAVLKITNPNKNQKSNINNKFVEILDYKTIPNDNKNIGKSLMNVEYQITEYIKKYNPDYCTIEQCFVSNNRLTAQRLSQVHGVLLLTLSKFDIPDFYYSVMTAKSQTLNGVKLKKEDGTKKTGNELKKEVANKVIEIFDKPQLKKEPSDITDAISIGVTFIKLGGNKK